MEQYRPRTTAARSNSPSSRVLVLEDGKTAKLNRTTRLHFLAATATEQSEMSKSVANVILLLCCYKYYLPVVCKYYLNIKINKINVNTPFLTNQYD